MKIMRNIVIEENQPRHEYLGLRILKNPEVPDPEKSPRPGFLSKIAIGQVTEKQAERDIDLAHGEYFAEAHDVSRRTALKIRRMGRHVYRRWTHVAGQALQRRGRRMTVSPAGRLRRATLH